MLDTVESGYQAHIAIKRTFAIRCMQSFCKLCVNRRSVLIRQRNGGQYES